MHVLWSDAEHIRRSAEAPVSGETWRATQPAKTGDKLSSLFTEDDNDPATPTHNR